MKKYLSLLGLVFAIMPAYSGQLSPEEALQRLNTSSMRRVATVDNVKPLTVISDKEGNSSLYLFSRGEGHGYLLVSADDCVPALLGYSEKGEIEASNMSPSLKWWLDEYSRQIEFIRKNPAFAPSIQSDYESVDNLPAVAPLVKTQWNQGEPYNLKCPKYLGEYCYTGCVATAMAQVMKYYNYPEKGVGSVKYYWQGGNKNLSLDFSNVTFDWKNMLDKYIEGEYSQEEADAVASLMMACGYSSYMQYSTYASNATTVDQAMALVDNFKYDASLDYILRDTYEYDDWAKVIYDNISAGHPVIYGGVDNIAGGHSFICDGYLDGYFHFNWGWSGDSDGYFLLDVLNPATQGIGGNAGGFSFMQDAVVNIFPAGDKKPVVEPIALTQLGNLNGNVEGDILSLGAVDTSIYGMVGWGNFNYRPFFGGVGVSLTSLSENGFTPLWIPGKGCRNEMYPPYNGLLQEEGYPGSLFTVDLSAADIPDGTYKVTVSTLEEGREPTSFTPVKFMPGYNNWITLIKTDGKYTVVNHPSDILEVSDFILLEDLSLYGLGKASVKIENQNESQLSRGVSLWVFDKENYKLLCISDGRLFTVNPGEMIDLEWTFSLYPVSGFSMTEPVPVLVLLYDDVTGAFYEQDLIETTLYLRNSGVSLPEIGNNIKIEKIGKNLYKLSGVYDEANVKVYILSGMECQFDFVNDGDGVSVRIPAPEDNPVVICITDAFGNVKSFKIK